MLDIGVLIMTPAVQWLLGCWLRVKGWGSGVRVKGSHFGGVGVQFRVKFGGMTSGEGC